MESIGPCSPGWKYVTQGCRSQPSCLPGNGRPLAWLVPPPHCTPANCPRKYRLHRNSPTHPLAAGRRRWNSPQTPNPSKPGTKKTRSIIRIHFRPLFLRRTASSTTGTCLDIASSLNPYHSPADNLYSKQTPATSFGFGSASFFLPFLDVRNHPRASSTSTNSSHPASRVEHVAVV